MATGVKQEMRMGFDYSSSIIPWD